MTEIAERIADFLKASLSVRGVTTVLIACGVIWLVSGWGLRGRLLAGWLLVPALLAVASFCIAGQEHLFPNRSFEGPHLLRFGDGDALTLTDLIGVALASLALLLALALIRQRIRALK